MLNKANMQWTSKKIKNEIEKGNLNFDCVVQRNLVWDNNRKSLLMHSMIEGYPIPPFYLAKRADGRFDALDGQQRSNAIKDFLTEAFVLTDNTPPITDENGYVVEIAGKKFSELPEWAQDNIKDYSLTIYYYEGITDEEIAELFYRINNGKPLTSVELTRVKAKSLEKFQEIAHHQLIAESITEVGKKRYNDENVAMQAWTLCFTDMRDFTTKEFRPFVETAEVAEDHVKILNRSMDLVHNVINGLNAEKKEEKRLIRKLRTRTHLVSAIYLAKKALEMDMPEQQFKIIVCKFFDDVKASTNRDYNMSVGSGSAKPERVKLRVQVLDSLLH